MPYDGAYVASFFADAGCTQPLAYGYGFCGGATPAYALGFGASQDYLGYPVTGVFGGTAYSGSPGSCSAITSPLVETLYTVGTALPPSSFAAVTKLAPGSVATADADLPHEGSRIALGAISTADGARGAWELHDSALGEDCYFEVAGDGAERCLPLWRMDALSDYYADSTCTQPVLAWSQTSALSIDYAYATDVHGCATSAYYSVGGAFGGTAYSNAGGTCSAASSTSVAYYSLSPFAASGFESGSTSVPAGPYDGFASGSRIQLKTITGSDGARGQGPWHDAQLGIDCYFYLAGDGAYRCIPYEMGYAGTYYADAACSTPLAYAGCAAPLFAESIKACGSGGTTYYEVGGVYGGATYVMGSTCVAVTQPTLTLYTVGAVVPASAFALGTLAE
jgi:hypothetical protein